MNIRKSLQRKSLLVIGITAALMMAAPFSQAQDATIIGVYENCQPISSTIIVNAPPDRDDQIDRIVAQAEAAGNGVDFDQGLSLMVSVLQEHGIEQVDIQKQGDCSVAGHGKFVEAIIGYCGEYFRSAEVRVDGDLLYQHRGTSLNYGEFVHTVREKLQGIGIFDEPRVSLVDASDCGQEVSS